jgi:hypothetical protein
VDSGVEALQRDEEGSMNAREWTAHNARRRLEKAEAYADHLRYCVEVADQDVEHYRREVERLEAAVLRQARAQA